MQMLLIFALLLFTAVLISDRAEHSVLSTSVLFLFVGLLLGRFVPMPTPGRAVLYTMAEVALYAVLFSDGMKTEGVAMLRSRWRPVVRVLLIGMPLTIALIAVLARAMLGMDWRSSAALGAVLSPTDPVFVAAIFSLGSVSQRVKETLSIESGFNDGLALPVIILLLPQVFWGHSSTGAVLLELVEGVALGIAIPWLAIRIEQLRLLGASGVYQRLYPFAIAVILYATCRLLNANLFIAAFTAGLTIATTRRVLRDAFEGFSEPVTELLKLGTILIFALQVGKLVLAEHSWKVYLLVLIAAFLVRLVAVPVALYRSDVSNRDKLLIGWFGPKGFASLVYGLLLLHPDIPALNYAARIVALTVVVSIFGYSSTDFLLGRWLERKTSAEDAAGSESGQAAG